MLLFFGPFLCGSRRYISGRTDRWEKRSAKQGEFDNPRLLLEMQPESKDVIADVENRSAPVLLTLPLHVVAIARPLLLDLGSLAGAERVGIGYSGVILPGETCCIGTGVQAIARQCACSIWREHSVQVQVPRLDSGISRSGQFFRLLPPGVRHSRVLHGRIATRLSCPCKEVCLCDGCTRKAVLPWALPCRHKANSKTEERQHEPANSKLGSRLDSAS